MFFNYNYLDFEKSFIGACGRWSCIEEIFYVMVYCITIKDMGELFNYLDEMINDEPITEEEKEYMYAKLVDFLVPKYLELESIVSPWIKSDSEVAVKDLFPHNVFTSPDHFVVNFIS